MTDNTAEVDDFDVFDDSIDLDADDPKEPVKEPEVKDEDPEPKGDKPEKDDDPEPPAGENKKTSVPLSALEAERRLRQQYQEEINRLKNQYEPEKDPNEPDPKEDPEGWKKWARDAAVKEAQSERIKLSKEVMMQEHPDEYDRMATTFIVLASIDPELQKKAENHPDPARFAFDTAKKYFADLEEGVRAKILAEQKPASEAVRKKSAKAPDLTGATAIGSNTTKIETIDDDDDLFEDSPYR